MTIRKLLLMSGLHLVIMYFLMFSMVNRIDNIYLNLNNLYMAVIMTAPMLILEIFLMGSMYKDKIALRIILAISVVAWIVFFTFIRRQTAIGDKEFIRSMVPHHSGAILMCRESNIKNQELKDLCGQIIESQQTEINQMEEILGRL